MGRFKASALVAGFFVLGGFLGVAGTAAYFLQPAVPPETKESRNLPEHYDALVSAMQEAGDFVESHKWYGTEREQAEAYRHILRILAGSMQSVLSDRDFPYFYEINPYTKSGMDNSDQRYLSVLINGEGVYRVWGRRGRHADLSFSVYEEDPMSGTLAALNADEMDIAADGSFELFLGGPERPGNWLPLQQGVQRLLVRQIHSDWNKELPGPVHIDRIDGQRPAYPELTRAGMADKLRNLTEAFATDVRRWPEYSRTRFDLLVPVNTLTKPRDVSASGGLAGRLMVGGHFLLQDDEALLVKAWPTGAKYQAIQLGHHWWESLDYANRQTSLTAEQARLSSDGAYYFVISKNDPRFPNWLDTEGFMRGVMFLRYDGLPENTLDEGLHPVARLVKIDELSDILPSDEPLVDLQERLSVVAERRRHVQQRFNF